MRELKLKLWLVIPLKAEFPTERVEEQLQKLLSHMANRISIKGIRDWRFELECDPGLREDPAACWKLFARFSKLLQRFGCDGLVGFGLPLGDMERIRQFYQLKPAGIPLPMQTFQAEPFLRLDTDEGTATFRSTDSSYLRNRILTIRQMIPEFRSGEIPLYITSWNNTTQRWNLLNDGCFRGAEILKDTIDSVGLVRAIAPRMPLDLMDSAALHGKMLFGGDGLITRNGIKKPSFYSYAFLSRSGNTVVARSENAIVLRNDRNYQIICHNSKRLSYRYYLDEQDLKLDRVEEYFDDMAPLRLRFRFKGLHDGKYIVKTRMVSPQSGSVQDIMRRMVDRSDIYLHPNDIQYLRQVSTPGMHLQQITVHGGATEL